MSIEGFRAHSDSLLTGMRDKRMSGGWFQDWRELASFILPKRYRWLMSTGLPSRHTAEPRLIETLSTLPAPWPLGPWPTACSQGPLTPLGPG
jgi:hypothetical protein